MSKPITDHTGQTFRSQAAMCKAWGISPQAYLTRINNGWSLEEALTTPVASRSAHISERSCTDHKGTEYPSHAAMCKHWGVNYTTYTSRIENGWSVEEALTGNRPDKRNRPTTDHTGQTFPTFTAMCEHWGVTRSVYEGRLKRGYTQEHALTTPVKKYRKRPWPPQP